MSSPPFCFVVMPFKPELNYFYLYVQKHLREKLGLRVERGDHKVLTKPLMEKIRNQIIEADVILADVTGANANVFYEVGLAHAFGRPVIFITQDDPADAPVDLRQFEFIRYDLRRHQDFLSTLDRAMGNVFVGKYRALYDEAIALLRQFNHDTDSAYEAASLEDFQARVMRQEQIQDIPPMDDRRWRKGFLLPKILREATDLVIMRKVMEWVNSSVD